MKVRQRPAHVTYRYCLGLAMAIFAGQVTAFSADVVPTGYHVIARYKIDQGGGGNYDTITLDEKSRRLYMAHSSKVEVVDADSGKLVGEVTDLVGGVHDTYAFPELGKGFVASGKLASVVVFDLKTFAHKAEIKTGQGVDAMLYDPDMHRLFVGLTHDAQIVVIDPVTEKIVARAPIGGATENMVIDEKGTMWATLEDKNMLVTLDEKTLQVKKTTPLPGCLTPSGMDIDPASRRLFIGCRGKRGGDPPILMIVDADNGNTITTFPVGWHLDETVFDPDTHLIFSPTGDGFITIVHEDSPDKYTFVEKVPTVRGCKGMAFDSKTKKIYQQTVANLPPTFPGIPLVTSPRDPGELGFIDTKDDPFLLVVVGK